MYRYDSIYTEGYPRKRYHAFILNNEGTTNQYPGEWWGEVFPQWGDSFLSERDAFEWLEKEFPGQSHAVQEVIWVAEPTKWAESNGRTIYLGKGWGMP